MKQMPAIVAIGYNRADTLDRLLRSVVAADYPEGEIPLIISIDHHPDNQPVIDVAHKIVWNHGPKIVKTHSQRMGLRPHVLECGNYSITYGCAIILEDDLFVSKDFYYYTVAAQEFYADNPKIAGVALYSCVRDKLCRNPFIPRASPWDTYFVGLSVSWGQSWTAKQWQAFMEWYHAHPVLEMIPGLPESTYRMPETSWAKFFQAYMVEQSKYYVCGYFARSTCFAEVGQHTIYKEIRYQTNLMWGVPEDYRFAPLDRGCKYDAYLESTELQPYLDKYTNGKPVRIAIHGEHLSGEEQYLLTMESLPYKVIADFAYEMTPPEMNIIQEIPGNSIHLYDMSVPDKPHENRFVTEQHDLCTLSVKHLLKYCKYIILRKIRRKLHIN